ncbi:ATP-binding cassette domain-containing protein [Synergistaceae bacterium OttesenSCG-928-I11]|nr:ATP-binding cassette domain-containing protein [Synergistaceae bacterium OttesenSCG-928-I11]
MARSDAMLSVRGVGYTYPGAPAPALNEVTLEVARGEWTALIGANGSGKSTFAKICNALLIPTQGACFVRALDTSIEENQRVIRQCVALVFQNPEDQIVASIVEEDVAFGPENLGLPHAEIRRRVDDALELVGLASYRRRGSYSLSGGQKQRLALAGALALAPEVLVLDESTSMLDPEGREDFLACLKSLKKNGMTIVQITHRMEEAVESDRIVVMSRGRNVWDGAPAAFFDGAYRNWDFEEPDEVALYRALLADGFVPNATPPTVDAMMGALCLS